MKPSLITLGLIAIACGGVLPSCTAVIDPTPNQSTATQSTTTSTAVNPYSGTTTQRRTTTTNY